MKIITMVGASAAMAFAALSFSSPARAQGAVGPVTRVGTACPSGYSQGNTAQSSKPNPALCYPSGSDAPAVYVKNGTCAAGYRSDFGYCTSKPDGAVYTPPTYGSIKKANRMDRCPVGYWTDQNDITSCVSPYRDKAPAARLKKGTGCSEGEVDEWGIYCTSRLHKLSRSEAENTAVADVNNLYVLSNGGTSPQGAEYENTPGIVALFPASSTPQTSHDAASSTTADQHAAQTAQCPTRNGSATGAAIGGAAGGQAGAALGGMLGGLGKKKKKAAGC